MTCRWITRLATLFVLAASYVPHPAAAQANAGGWQVVLAAGDSAQPVFDNATRALSAMLVGKGVPPANIHRLTSNPRELGTAAPAVKSVLLQTIAGLNGSRCLIFLTSHGTHEGDFYLAGRNEVLTPNELAGALALGCGRVPTVVIVSACFSGAFASGAMDWPNRIILTAARADRPSFGCAADRDYTYFDSCLLGVLQVAPSWRAVYDQTAACVRQTEQQTNQTPSEPQAYFGPAFSALPVFIAGDTAHPAFADATRALGTMLAASVSAVPSGRFGFGESELGRSPPLFRLD
ncbi:MAG: hypothetical protein JO267_10055 [Alphaproteobacteria bacterium]|nr:hypothetical protein [Alphaproteobacteria bacterium]MBV9862476.1 hypothetical protein [Alphaproteobacteria bacterium]